MRRLGGLAVVSGAAVVLGNVWIEFRARGRIYQTLANVPQTDIALVLGTSARLRSGHANAFFTGRMDAAAELYRAGKVRHLLLSGNRTAGYDEPTSMREALLARGVPEAATTLDYAGFRTLDSFARAKKVFGVSRVLIVTDDFHTARSVFLARHFEIDARAYSSKPAALGWSMRTRVREIAARCKALLDLYVLRTKPRFLGPPIRLPIENGGR